MNRVLPSVSHPTDRPNFTRVVVGDLTCWFSYSTCIGFHTPETGTVVSENRWGNTTGRHINHVDDRKDRRVARPMFEAMLQSVVTGEPVDVVESPRARVGVDGHRFDPSVGDAEIAAWRELLAGGAR